MATLGPGWNPGPLGLRAWVLDVLGWGALGRSLPVDRPHAVLVWVVAPIAVGLPAWLRPVLAVRRRFGAARKGGRGPCGSRQTTTGP